MMTGGWNYRVVKTIGHGEDQYAVHEVYYTDGAPGGLTQNEVSPAGDSSTELLASWQNYQTAFTKPVLVFDQQNNCFVGEELPISPPAAAGGEHLARITQLEQEIGEMHAALRHLSVVMRQGQADRAEPKRVVEQTDDYEM